MPEDEPPTSENDQNESEDIKILRKKAKNHDTAVSERDAARRELALLRAGIPDSPLGKLFAKGYDGEWSDVDAIKAAAVEYGVIEAPKPDVSQEEQQAHQRVDQATSSGTGGDPGTDWDAELAKARTPEEFDRIYARSGRAMKGGG